LFKIVKITTKKWTVGDKQLKTDRDILSIALFIYHTYVYFYDINWNHSVDK
jgi:hypothetical protein